MDEGSQRDVKGLNSIRYRDGDIQESGREYIRNAEMTGDSRG